VDEKGDIRFAMGIQVVVRVLADALRHADGMVKSVAGTGTGMWNARAQEVMIGEGERCIWREESEERGYSWFKHQIWRLQGESSSDIPM
jgi:uncharacterized protein (UPF0548 family)